MKHTIESVNNDLEKLQRLFGATFIRVLCASIILEHCDWNWTKIKSGIITDSESQQLKAKVENE